MALSAAHAVALTFITSLILGPHVSMESLGEVARGRNRRAHLRLLQMHLGVRGPGHGVFHRCGERCGRIAGGV